MTNLVLFGGCGYIGLNFTDIIKDNKNFNNIYLVDLNEPKTEYLKIKFNKLKKYQNIEFIRADVRQNLNFLKFNDINLIIDCSAIHREPGHKNEEYFETNVTGSKNIINFAKINNCRNLIFISSISVYGKGQLEKNESSPTYPTTAYGKSKLNAEKNYIEWQKNDPLSNILTICRPGVVYGPGETGNVTRLIKAVKKNNFLYLGNKKLKKAGIYIKELINMIMWVNLNQKKKKFENFELFNATFQPCPSLNDYIDSISNIYSKKKNYLNFPKFLVKFLLFISSPITKRLNINSNYNYVRLNKLFVSNYIKPKFLIEKNYVFQYDIKNSMKDWQETYKQDWQ